MKHFYTLLIMVALCHTTLSQNDYVDHRGDTHLWGSHTPMALQHQPYINWYNKSLESFDPDLSLFLQIGALKEMNVKIYMGTWCGVTKNWVPKFLTLWETIGLSHDNVEMIALRGEMKYYKQGPNREEDGMNIHRVPTFIFEKEGNEVARIVERPVSSLEDDLAQIDRGVPTLPRYQAVAYLDRFFSQHFDYEYQEHEDELLKNLYRKVGGPGELNTYGYVLKNAGKIDEALLAFRLNAQLYKYDPNCQDSLGELYLDIEKYDGAKDCFERVLDLYNHNERAIAMLYQINEKLKNKE